MDFGVIEAEKIRGRGEGDEAPGVKEGDPPAEKESFANVVGNEDDRFVEAASEGAEFPLKFGTSDGIEGAERLVHEKDGRVGSKCAGDADALALAAGKLAGVAGGIFSRIETY
jgi:hypothetical protein